MAKDDVNADTYLCLFILPPAEISKQIRKTSSTNVPTKCCIKLMFSYFTQKIDGSLRNYRIIPFPLQRDRSKGTS